MSIFDQIVNSVKYVADVEAQTGDNFLEKTYNWVATQPDMVGSVAV
jgi:hypothetical protein